MKIKNVWKLFPVLIIVAIIVFFESKSFIERQNFYKSEINSYIVKKSNNWSGGRSYDYLTSSNIVITLMSNNDLRLGDSISKPASSAQFKVYRKDKSGNYKFYINYNTP